MLQTAVGITSPCVYGSPSVLNELTSMRREANSVSSYVGQPDHPAEPVDRLDDPLGIDALVEFSPAAFVAIGGGVAARGAAIRYPDAWFVVAPYVPWIEMLAIWLP